MRHHTANIGNGCVNERHIGFFHLHVLNDGTFLMDGCGERIKKA